MPTIPLNDIQLHYEEYGSPSPSTPSSASPTALPLVLVHGFSSAGLVWNGFLPAFSAFRVIVPDLRGHGHSTGTLETIHHANFASDLLALLDALDIEKAHFVGHSSGGMCLLFIARDKPERIASLTLVSATYTFDAHARANILQVAEGIGRLAAVANSRKLHSETHGPECWKMHQQAFRNFTTDPQELPFQPPDLAKMDVPALILHGDRDPFFPIYIPVKMYESMPDAQLCILPNTGHDLPGQHPRMFGRLVLKFINGTSLPEKR